LLFAGLLVKENVAVSDIGMRVALICAVLSAVAYECLTMLITAIRVHFSFGSEEKVSIEMSEIDSAKNIQSLEQNNVKEIDLLKTQFNEHTQKIKEKKEENRILKELLQEERKRKQYLTTHSKVARKLQ
jgi:hypothetical protein